MADWPYACDYTPRVVTADPIVLLGSTEPAGQEEQITPLSGDEESK